MTEIIANSSSIGTIKIANKMSPRDLAGVQDFGFGTESLAATYPGGGAGTFPTTTEPTKLSVALAWGEDGFRVSPLEMVLAYGALVNGGKLLKPVPYQSNEKAKVVRQVISPGASHTMREILSEVVRNGTGKKAKAPSYMTGGKTASSPVLENFEGPSPYAPLASFVGFAPAREPKIVIFVGVEKLPKAHGSEHAAPIFSRIAEASLRELKVAPDQ